MVWDYPYHFLNTGDIWHETKSVLRGGSVCELSVSDNGM